MYVYFRESKTCKSVAVGPYLIILEQFFNIANNNKWYDQRPMQIYQELLLYGYYIKSDPSIN